MAGKAKRWVVLAVVLAVVVAGGIFFAASKSDKPEVSINFIGFTNGPQGQIQASFAISAHATQSPDWKYFHLIRGDGDDCGDASILPTEYPYPFRPHVTADIPQCAHHFRLEVFVGFTSWKNRLASSSAVQRTFLSKLVPNSWDYPDTSIYTNQWIPNPYHTNQAQPKPPE